MAAVALARGRRRKSYIPRVLMGSPPAETSWCAPGHHLRQAV